MKQEIIKDIHHFKHKLDLEFKRVEEDTNISKANKKIIKDFYNHCISKGLSSSKTYNYLIILRKIALKLNKDFNKATKENIKEFIAYINKSDYSDWYKVAYKIAIKLIYKFIDGIEKRGIYPEKVDWISTTQKNGLMKLPEELLTQEEIMKLVNTATRTRDKALVFMLYESACRIGELATLQIKHCSFDENGAKIRVDGKTGTRLIRLINSAPILKSWLNEHPLKDNPNSPLWIHLENNKLNTQFSYGAIKKMIKRLADRCNIKKKINPHAFRHSRATFLANHLTEAQLKQVCGWVNHSKMASVYVHLSSKDTDDAVLRASGIKVAEKEIKNKLTAKICPRCDVKNNFENKYCSKCWLPLDQETAIKDHTREKILNEASKQQVSLTVEDLTKVVKLMIKEKKLPKPQKLIQHLEIKPIRRIK